MLKREGNNNTSMNPEQGGLPVRVILTGYRATGKSVVGSQLAKLLGYRFVDTDQELAAVMCCSVAEYVRKHGWQSFRQLEKKLLERLAGMNHVVIATGGGAVLHQDEWQNLHKQSLVVWLQADAQTISDRLRVDPASQMQRPSLTGAGTIEEIESVLEERETMYQQGSDMAIDSATQSPGEIATEIHRHITSTRKV